MKLTMKLTIRHFHIDSGSEFKPSRIAQAKEKRLVESCLPSRQTEERTVKEEGRRQEQLQEPGATRKSNDVFPLTACLSSPLSRFRRIAEHSLPRSVDFGAGKVNAVKAGF